MLAAKAKSPAATDAGTQDPPFSVRRRHEAAIALADYVIAELERGRPLMGILDDPPVCAMVEGREYLLGDLACNGLFLETLRARR